MRSFIRAHCAFAAGLLGRIRQANAALREGERRYRELSITDDLTKLFNTRSLSSRLQNELDRVQRYGHALSLLILDLDNFKLFNDTYGHIAGDKVLARAGEILRRSLRKTDSAFRYGGEEFIALLPETTGHEALKFAERIRPAVNWLLRHRLKMENAISLIIKHEFGHLQTVPFALLYGGILLSVPIGQGTISWFKILFLTVSTQAVWEMMSSIFTL